MLIQTTCDLPDRTSLFGYLQNPSLVDFPGRLSAVFFTTGCNFQCRFCHNASLLGTPNPEKGLRASELHRIITRFRSSSWINGVTLTGGEPTLCEDLPELVAWMRSIGLAVKLDTNGSHPEMLARIIGDLDYVAMDIKCRWDDYPSLTRFADTAAIARSMEIIRSSGVDYEFRTTILESLHTPETMHELGRMISGAKRYVLQQFVPRENLPDIVLRTTPRTSPDHLEMLQGIMKQYADEVIWKGHQ